MIKPAELVSIVRRRSVHNPLQQVGYKMRLFGDDAEIASQVCHVGCWQDRNYLTAGIPVHRLHVHVRKLVDAGHKVSQCTGCT